MTAFTLPSPPAPPHSGRGIENYYRLHARIYDSTRWSFLFGRDTILDQAAAAQPAPARILEIGCGTGRNLLALARRFPRARLTGVDLSDSMLALAKRKTVSCGPRVQLVQRAYNAPLDATHGFDLVLCSYALSMFNPGFEEAIATANRDLAPGGHFALVDFHTTRFPWYARWMGVNHVRMDGQLRPVLQDAFLAVTDELHSAYGGVWQYLQFVGRKP
jgi:S-adenosylmethionine-diacylgycerolhomoserine-N-methlytransferase